VSKRVMEQLHDRGPTVYAVVLALIIVATVFIVLRVISKLGITRRATADDFVAIVAWALDVGLSIMILVGTKVGLGAPDSGEFAFGDWNVGGLTVQKYLYGGNCRSNAASTPSLCSTTRLCRP
jgi:hypothetical protein